MVEQLKKYIIENDLQNKSIVNFWVAFNDWKKDYPQEYTNIFDNISINDLNIFVHSIGIRSSEWPECDFSHITVTILIQHNGRLLGNYVNWISLSDDVYDDDFLEIFY